MLHDRYDLSGAAAQGLVEYHVDRLSHVQTTQRLIRRAVGLDVIGTVADLDRSAPGSRSPVAGEHGTIGTGAPANVGLQAQPQSYSAHRETQFSWFHCR